MAGRKSRFLPSEPLTGAAGRIPTLRNPQVPPANACVLSFLFTPGLATPRPNFSQRRGKQAHPHLLLGKLERAGPSSC